MNTATLQIRIDTKTKQGAQKLFAELGMDLSSAVKLFLTQSISEQGLPFRPKRTMKEIADEWKAESKEAIKNGKRYSSAKDAHRDILGG